MRLKKLPSMKGKTRYIIFRIHTDLNLDYDNVRNAIWNSLENWLGESDLAQANIQIIKNLWNPREHKGYVRCTSKYVDHIKVGLSLIHNVGDSKVIFQTLRVTGTIKSGKEKT